MPYYFLLYYLSFRLNKLQNVWQKIKSIPTIESEKIAIKVQERPFIYDIPSIFAILSVGFLLIE